MKFKTHFLPVLKAIAHGIFFLAICLASFALGRLAHTVAHPQTTIQPAKECK